MHKMDIKNPDPKSKRYESIQKYGYDIKYAYHIVRLLDEVEQILTLHDLDLERNREQLKSIRRGEWKKEDIKDYFNRNEKRLADLYLTSDLQYSPDEEKIKSLLLECLEMYYGSIDKCITVNKKPKINKLLNSIEKLIEEIKTTPY